MGASFHPRKLKTLMIPTAWTAHIRVACSPWLANFDRNPLSAPARETPQTTTPIAKKTTLEINLRALEGCEGLWSYDYGACMMSSTPLAPRSPLCHKLRRCHPWARKSASQAVHSRMQPALQATRPNTSRFAWRLVRSNACMVGNNPTCSAPAL